MTTRPLIAFPVMVKVNLYRTIESIRYNISLGEASPIRIPKYLNFCLRLDGCKMQAKARCSEVKLIPLKLFYYQTFFETWYNHHSWYEHWKNAIKRCGHSSCLRVSGLLNWGIFTACSLNIRIPFKQNLVFVTWNTQNFIWNIKLLLFK